MNRQTVHIMTIANSIIGVSILAMPYCFKQCGIILSVIVLIISSVISRLSCHLLLKSAIISRRRTFEFLAFHTFGVLGKFVIEVGIIGFLLGTCIAFFVVMGDLGPVILAKVTGTAATNTMRTSILMALALFCVLPLGLLRNIDSLSSVCAATVAFYFCLVLKIIAESTSHIIVGDWINKVEWWRPSGILQCLPIFSMALFCQTQIFEIYQALPNASLEKMNDLIRVAVNICTAVYIFVGVFGYIGFSNQAFSGNILMSFSPSFMSDIIKVGFVLSLAFSFPLVIFPCRASLYSLLYQRLHSYTLHDGGDKYIPEGRFKLLTFVIVFTSLVTGVMIPNIELVLGLVGSTIGVMICVLFPAISYISISTKNTNERLLAQVMLFIGFFVMVLGTYANLYPVNEINENFNTEVAYTAEKLNLHKVDDNMGAITDAAKHAETNFQENILNQKNEVKNEDSTHSNILQHLSIGELDKKGINERKQILSEKDKSNNNSPSVIISKQNIIKENFIKTANTIKLNYNEKSLLKFTKDYMANTAEYARNNLIKKTLSNNLEILSQKVDEVDSEAIEKEDRELLEQESENLKKDYKSKQMKTAQVEKSKENELNIVQDKQLQLIKNVIKQEKIKAVEEIEETARKAIEKLSENEENYLKNKQFNEQHRQAGVQRNTDINYLGLQNISNEIKLEKSQLQRNVTENNVKIELKHKEVFPIPVISSKNISRGLKVTRFINDSSYSNVSSNNNLSMGLNSKAAIDQNKTADEFRMFNFLKSQIDEKGNIKQFNNENYVRREIPTVNASTSYLLKKNNVIEMIADLAQKDKIRSKNCITENCEKNKENNSATKVNQNKQNAHNVLFASVNNVTMLPVLELVSTSTVNDDSILKPLQRDLKSYHNKKKK